MPATASALAPAVSSDLKLLSHAQIRDFLVNGFLVLKADQDKAFFDSLYQHCNRMLAERKGNEGNNILPHMPEIQEIFDCPTIKGALTSILGPRYMMHPHRHMHTNAKGEGGGWHKDSYWGYTRKVRNHRPWWVMIMFYPQDTPHEMGPTGVARGSHCHEERLGDPRSNDEPGAVHVAGDAGTCFLIHYDIWHRATPNITTNTRHMLKFEFMRLDPPFESGQELLPSWSAPEVDLPPAPHQGMWRQQWNWLRGDRAPAAREGDSGNVARLIAALKNTDAQERSRAADQLEALGSGASEAVPALIETLADKYEPAALNAAYALASIGKDAIAPSIDALRSSDKRVSLRAAYALAAMDSAVVPALLPVLANDPEPRLRAYAAYALGEIPSTDPKLIAALGRALRDVDPFVRHCAIEALGHKGAAAKAALDGILETLSDGDPEVRFNAVLTLCRMGKVAEPAIGALAKCLKDPDRYVRGYAVEALRHLGTPEAHAILIPYLMTTRWCESTTHESTFYP
ncbi:MAG TPA: HEAT repeat domain-containing protein [Planctomycetota bacterium]|nr:HEAT repeat domain-containing protein [Planctomycetota bacterium]